MKLSCEKKKKSKIQLAPSISAVLIAIFAYISATPISNAQVVRRNASSTNEKSLNLNIRHTLNARSSATTSGNTKVKAEANIKIAPGSTITSTIGGDNSSSTIEFNTEENSFDLSATGIESEAVYVLDESTQLYSVIEKIDSSANENHSELTNHEEDEVGDQISAEESNAAKDPDNENNDDKEAEETDSCTKEEVEEPPIVQKHTWAWGRFSIKGVRL